MCNIWTRKWVILFNSWNRKKWLQSSSLHLVASSKNASFPYIIFLPINVISMRKPLIFLACQFLMIFLFHFAFNSIQNEFKKARNWIKNDPKSRKVWNKLLFISWDEINGHLYHLVKWMTQNYQLIIQKIILK